MDAKSKFTAETVRKLQQALDDVPPYQATELSKQQAIRSLSPQILSLRSKGYSWAAIAAKLSEQGVPVSVAALRTYLRRVREEVPVEARRSPPKRPRETRVEDPQPGGAPAAVTSPPRGAERSAASKPVQAGTVLGSSVATAPTPPREQEPRRSGFTVGRDTKDL